MPKSSQPPANVPIPPTPGKLVVQKYPTPNLDSRIYVERVDTRVVKNAVPPVPGSPYTGPDPDRYEGFMFATAIPSDQGGYVDYFWVNERLNQDAFNFEVEYPWISKDYPRVSRTYVLLRSDAPVPDPDEKDPANADLSIVTFQEARSQDPVIDSLFVGITKVFERLPAPTDFTMARDDSDIPYGMRNLVPAITVSEFDEGPATAADLAIQVNESDWNIVSNMVSAFKRKITRVKRFIPPGGAVLNKGVKLTRDQQIGAVTQTWKIGPQIIVPHATLVDADIDDLGNNTTVKTETEVDRVFPATALSVEIQDAVPPEFRLLSPVRTTGITIEGQVQEPVLGPGEFAKSETQQTDFIKRTQVTDHDLTQLPRTLTDKATSEVFGFGGVLDTTRTLDSAPQAVEEGVRVVSSSVRDLGNGLTLKETTKLPGEGGATLQLDDGGTNYSTPPAINFDNTGGVLGVQGAATAVMAPAGSGLGLDPGGVFDLNTYTIGGDTGGVFYFLGTRTSDIYTNPVAIGSSVGLNWRNKATPENSYSAAIYNDFGNGSLAYLTGRAPSTTSIFPDWGVGNQGDPYHDGRLVVDLGKGTTLAMGRATLRRTSVDQSGYSADIVVIDGSNDNINWSLVATDDLANKGPDAWNSLGAINHTPFRYFRIQRTSGTDQAGQNMFQLGQIEFYGTLTITPTKTLTYSYNGDNNGVFTYLGQLGNRGVWRNPQTNGDVNIYAPYDTFALGTPDSLVDHQASNTYLNFRERAELWFDLGAGRKLTMKAVSHRQRANYNSSGINFSWQGSNDGATWGVPWGQTVSQIASEWTTTELNSDAVMAQTAYRYFRILLPVGANFLSAGEFEFYGDLSFPVNMTPDLVVSGVNVTNGGSYVSAPQVAFTGGGATTQAAGTAIVTDGALTGIIVSSPGEGYTSTPHIGLSGGLGTGATAHALLGKAVASVLVTSGGSGYTTPPGVSFAPVPYPGGAGGGAVGVAVLSSGVTSARVTNGGSGYASNPSVVIQPGGTSTKGSGAAATAVRGFPVSTVAVTAPGSGYLQPPAVIFAGDGTGARGRAIFGDGVSNPIITNPGSGYTTPPTVAFTPAGAGSGAAGVSVLGFAVASVTIDDGGAFYTSAPTVAFSGGGGSGAAATAKLALGLNSITLLNPGSGYTADPTIAFTGGGGTGAAATATRGLGVDSATVTAGGSGYTAATVAFDAPLGGGTTATGTVVLTADVVTGITITNPGSGYTSIPLATISGDGTLATADAVLTASGPLKEILITDAGSGFTTAPAVVITGDGTGASAKAVVSLTGKIASILVTNGGAFYTSAPLVTLTGGGGTGADLTAVLAATGSVIKVSMSDYGTGYTSAPTVGFTGDGAGAAAYVNSGTPSTAVASIFIDDPGSGYTSAPTVSFQPQPGDPGSGAAATAALSTVGIVKSVTITAPGSGYEVPAAITFAGGGGTGAAAEATLSSGGLVTRVIVTHGGEKYTSPPNISFAGGSGGSGAAATAVLAPTGPVVAALLDTPGTYVTVPGVTIDGGGGSGAHVTYILGSDTGWDILYQTVIDETTGISVLIKKEIVPAGTRYSGKGYEEIQPLDKWRSIRLTSVVDASTLPQPEVFFSWTPYRFPPELISIVALWTSSSTSTGLTPTDQWKQTTGADQALGATRSSSAESRGSAAVNIRDGYNGPCKSETTRTYLPGPPACSNTPEPLFIQPSSGTVVVSGGGSSSSDVYRIQDYSVGYGPVNGQSGGGNPTSIDVNKGWAPTSSSVSTNMSVEHISGVMTGDHTVQNSGGGGMTVSLLPSTPAKFSPGQVFISDVRVTKLRFGLWMIEVVRITVPPGACVEVEVAPSFPTPIAWWKLEPPV